MTKGYADSLYCPIASCGGSNLTGSNNTFYNISTTVLCIGGDCQSVWPSGSGNSSWNESYARTLFPMNSTDISLNFLQVNNTAGANTVAAVWSNVNGYAELNLKNYNNGSSASADLVVTANNGDASNYYLDCGINNQNYSNSQFRYQKGDDGYCYVQNGSFFLGTTSNNTQVAFITNNTVRGNITPAGVFNWYVTSTFGGAITGTSYTGTSFTGTASIGTSKSTVSTAIGGTDVWESADGAARKVKGDTAIWINNGSTNTISTNASFFGLYINPQVTEASSGTHSIIGAAVFHPPKITAGNAQVNRTATVWITGPTFANGSKSNLSLLINGTAEFLNNITMKAPNGSYFSCGPSNTGVWTCQPTLY